MRLKNENGLNLEFRAMHNCLVLVRDYQKLYVRVVTNNDGMSFFP